MIVWFILVMIAVAFLQGRVLIKQKYWGELAAFGVLWLVATVYASLVILGVPLPSPFSIIASFIKKIYRFLGISMLS